MSSCLTLQSSTTANRNRVSLSAAPQYSGPVADLCTHLFPPWLITLGLKGVQCRSWTIFGCETPLLPQVLDWHDALSQMSPASLLPEGGDINWWTFALKVQGKLRKKQEAPIPQRLKFEDYPAHWNDVQEFILDTLLGHIHFKCDWSLM